MDNGFEVEQSFVKKFVYYNEVKFVRLRHLLGGVLQAQLDHLGAVFSTALQPSAQFLHAGRQNENQHGIGEQLFDLHRALEVNLQNNVHAMSDPLFNRGA